jgi:cytochrome P450
MISALHIFKEKGLLDRVRRDIQECVGERPVRDTEPQQISKDTPLLSSIYAETLRLHLKLHSVYSSPHEDVNFEKWVLPKGALAFLSSEPSHMDETFWNTKDEQHPVGSFWQIASL